MVRSFSLLPALLCAAAIATAQTPAPERPTATAGEAPAVQQPAPQQPPAQQPAAPMPEKSAVSKVTYTGCVKPGTAPESWILENAEVVKPGQATAATSGAMKSTLNLTTKVGTDSEAAREPQDRSRGHGCPGKAWCRAWSARASGVHGRVGQDGFGDLSVRSCP